jgi:hypothetical protein
MKTTKEIIDENMIEEEQFCEFCDPLPIRYINPEFKNQKWYSEEELRMQLLDMYRLMCNEYGKANIWSMNPEELLEKVDLLIEKKLF